MLIVTELPYVRQVLGASQEIICRVIVAEDKHVTLDADPSSQARSW
jgi:hypothetical protein